MKTSRGKGNNSARFLLAGVRVFLKNSELSQMTIQNEYGSISVSRDIPTKTVTQTVGFAEHFESEEEY